MQPKSAARALVPSSLRKWSTALSSRSRGRHWFVPSSHASTRLTTLGVDIHAELARLLHRLHQLGALPFPRTAPAGAGATGARSTDARAFRAVRAPVPHRPSARLAHTLAARDRAGRSEPTPAAGLGGCSAADRVRMGQTVHASNSMSIACFGWHLPSVDPALSGCLLGAREACYVTRKFRVSCARSPVTLHVVLLQGSVRRRAARPSRVSAVHALGCSARLSRCALFSKARWSWDGLKPSPTRVVLASRLRACFRPHLRHVPACPRPRRRH
jgi:hypothetical protein